MIAFCSRWNKPVAKQRRYTFYLKTKEPHVDDVPSAPLRTANPCVASFCSRNLLADSCCNIRRFCFKHFHFCSQLVNCFSRIHKLIQILYGLRFDRPRPWLLFSFSSWEFDSFANFGCRKNLSFSLSCFVCCDTRNVSDFYSFSVILSF